MESYFALLITYSEMKELTTNLVNLTSYCGDSLKLLLIIKTLNYSLSY